MNQRMTWPAWARRARSAAPLLAIGGLCGLTWAAALRSFMAELAGAGSDVGWYGTFAQVLLPGAVAGALLGWAEQIRRTGGRGGWRRGPRWSRILLGVIALVPIPGWAIASSAFGPAFALTTPRGAWVALFFYSLIATLDLACAIPHRPVVPAVLDPQPDPTAGRDVQRIRAEEQSKTPGLAQR